MSERIDLDRLADFVGGALDGTPEAAEVRRLVDTDPAWSEAYTVLVAADAEIAAALAGHAVDDAAMPADVAARLDTALRSLGTHEVGTAGPDVVRSSRPVPADRSRPADRSGPGRGAVGAAGSAPGGSGPACSGSGPGRRASRRARWAAALSAVAAVVAVGFGLLVYLPQRVDNSTTDTTARSDGAGVAAPGPASLAQSVASGRDYQPGQFAALATTSTFSQPHVAAEAPAPGDDGRRPATSAERSVSTYAAPAELRRLAEPAALTACLDAVRAVHGGLVRVVDFARFQRRPALIVLLSEASTGGGQPWIVVVGPDCGEPAGTSDERFNGPVS